MRAQPDPRVGRVDPCLTYEYREEVILDYALLSAGSLFAILSPFATAPTFLAITENESAARQVTMAARACVLSFVILVLFSVLGEPILASFRVTVPALQMAGGIVILRIGLQLMSGERGRLTPAERTQAAEKEDVTVTPLAVPILCGPGTISTGIVLGVEASSVGEYVTLVVVIALIYAMTFGFLFAGVRSTRWISPLALRITGRLMGMLLAAVAMQFMISGITTAFPGVLGVPAIAPTN